MEPDTPRSVYFRLFNEIAILEQLSRALLDVRLPKGLIAPHFAVLNSLVRVRDGRTPLEMARAFQVPKTTMTHTLAGLETAGLVAMRPNPEDGRSKQVWITVAGRAMREATISALEPDLMSLAAEFPPNRAAAILPHLESLRQIMDAARD